MRDVVGVSESTNWSQRSKAAARYHALCCDITPLDPTHQEYADIRDHVMGSQDRYSKNMAGSLCVSFFCVVSIVPSMLLSSLCEELEVVNIFSVHRAVEDSNFAHSMGNKQLLFHSSQLQNFVGILSRLVVN